MLTEISATVIVMVLAHLFIKITWPRDSEGSFSVFESSCHLLLSVIKIRKKNILTVYTT